MPGVPQEVRDAVMGTYTAWRPYTATTTVADGDTVFADALARITALQVRIEHNRANPIFAAEPTTTQTGA